MKIRKYIFIGLGGFLGAILRYLIKDIKVFKYINFPLHTFIINMTGTFLLAFVITLAYEIKEFDIDIKLGITVGLLGAYTTFSTICKEVVMLLYRSEYFLANIYIVLSIIIGLISVYLGIGFAKNLKRRNKKI